jgi:hypothetical protein
MYTFHLPPTNLPPRPARFLLNKTLKNHPKWVQKIENPDFGLRFSDAKIRLGITHLDYLLLANKVQNHQMFNNLYFYPETYLIDKKDNTWKTFIQNIILENKENDIWFLKPENGGKGVGIILLNKNSDFEAELAQADQTKYVLQKGVKNIHLFQNKKYDLRVHVVFVKKNREIIPLLYPIADVRLSPKVYQDQKLDKESILTFQKEGSHETIPSNVIKEYQKYFANLTKVMKDACKIVSASISANITKWEDSVEFWITGFDLIMTNDGQFYILEFNEFPNMLQKKQVHLHHRKIILGVLENVVEEYLKNENIKEGPFIKI